MIITGDVAIAPGDRFLFLGFSERLATMPWCLNLEGAIMEGDSQMPRWGVCNASDWRLSFQGLPMAPIFIGNNHIHDLPNGVARTLHHLAQDGLTAFGAGLSARDASDPGLVASGNSRNALLGFGWDVIGCRPAGEASPGVNRLEGRNVLHLLEERMRAVDADRTIVIIHGNYEFERYPQPGHRSLALQLIDHGAHVVVFHHSHIVCPVERYKGRTIAYGLGNWAFSHGRFFDGKLRFPESSFAQIALEVGDKGDVVHHARFEPPNIVRHTDSERVDASDFTLRPVFEGFGQGEYLAWFKQNRVKRKGLPVYTDAADSPLNAVRDSWVGARQVLIDFAARAGIKAMRRGT